MSGALAPRLAAAGRERLRREAIERLLELVETDETLSGVTIILPSGEMEFVSAATLRQGGRA